MKMTKSELKEIRYYCLHNCSRNMGAKTKALAVKYCNSDLCAKWPFRFGKLPREVKDRSLFRRSANWAHGLGAEYRKELNRPFRMR